MLATPGCGLRRLIAATERSELPSGLDTNEELYRIPNQSGSLADPGQFLGARKQVIIECHSGSHAYLHIQDSITSFII